MESYDYKHFGKVKDIPNNEDLMMIQDDYGIEFYKNEISLNKYDKNLFNYFWIDISIGEITELYGSYGYCNNDTVYKFTKIFNRPLI